MNPIFIQTSFAIDLSMFINFGCCLAVVILPIFIFFVLVYISKKQKKSSSSSREEVEYTSEQEKTVDISDIEEEADNYRSERLDTGGFSKKKKTPISKIKGLFGKKKVCDDCGTELIYKEDYDSWYCPECHQYT